MHRLTPDTFTSPKILYRTQVYLGKFPISEWGKLIVGFDLFDEIASLDSLRINDLVFFYFLFVNLLFLIALPSLPEYSP